MLKKGDIILCLILLALCGVLFFVLRPHGAGSTVVILENNIETHRVPIGEDAVIALPGNTVVIENGRVYMKSADCPDKVCVHHRKISSAGESIICLPNGVVAEVE